MAARPITNLERFLMQRFQTAHDALETDEAAAKRGFLSLLREPRLPLWARTQCNLLMGYICDLDEADYYLANARQSLVLFTDSCTTSDPDVPAMEQALEDLASDIAVRKQARTIADGDTVTREPEQ